jgi:hypothetical protein
VKAAYGNLSTFVGYFLLDPAGEGEDILNGDSTAINSSLQCREKERKQHDKMDAWPPTGGCEQLRVWFVVIDLGKDSWFV